VSTRILITGGAGFIGSHLADALLAHGHAVRVLDSLVSQVHGSGQTRPPYLADDVDLIVGDVCDAAAVRAALDGVDAVYHFAARVGVGQSMYDIAQYVHANDVGTATLLEALISHPVSRLIVASSMSVYGEGLYRDARGRAVTDAARPIDRLRLGLWEPAGSLGEPLQPVPTPETKPPALTSVYALSKFDQERLCLMVGRAYGIPTVALRFFNVYGTRQALSNPYTGVIAIFAARLLNGRAPLLFEDGRQLRDFVHVSDVVEACRLALDSPAAPGRVFNVASGQALTVTQVAEGLSAVLGAGPVSPEVTGAHRVGDIRHCFADISDARTLLGYEPRTTFADGLTQLADWLVGEAAIDRVDQARAELDARGLTV
jgi:dTDP-L-rhamnose 4-epimerase